MYLNGSNSVKVNLVCVILGSAHKDSVFSSIELRMILLSALFIRTNCTLFISTLCILMGFPIQIKAKRMEKSSLCLKGSQIGIPIYDCF